MNENPFIKPDLSVVILCYRAEDFVPVFVREMKETLEKEQLNYELVLVANYHQDAPKPDKTPEIVRQLAQNDPRIVVVAREKEGMMGWDMRTGLDAATGENIAVIDGDGQMPPQDIIKVYNLLKEGKFDVAKTYRDERFDGLVRVVISRVYNFVFKILFPKTTVRDVNSKPKIFTRAALDQLKLTSDDWFIDAEIIIRATQLRFSIGEVETQFFPNKYRNSFVRFTTIFEFIKNFLHFRWGNIFKK